MGKELDKRGIYYQILAESNNNDNAIDCLKCNLNKFCIVKYFLKNNNYVS